MRVLSNINRIWEHYAGWFKHASTTELYAQPRSVIHGDLIELAGGPLAIVQRAQEKLDAMQFVEALHLLDILLPEQRQMPEAVSAAIAAHEGLLQDSENFWLSSWLKNQIKQLQTDSICGWGYCIQVVCPAGR